MSTGAAALESAAGELGVPLSAAQIAGLLAYRDLLVRWNATYNLTSVRDADAMLGQHLVDCLAVVPGLQRECPAGGQLLDVGSGGGLPGVVVAIAAPGWRVVCVDTVGKKAAFVRQVAAELALGNVSAVHGRVETLPAAAANVIASRAFSALDSFASMTRAHLGRGGVWMAMKGKVPDVEIAALPPSVDVFHVEPLIVPGLNAQRCIVWMRPTNGLAPPAAPETAIPSDDT